MPQGDETLLDKLVSLIVNHNATVYSSLFALYAKVQEPFMVNLDRLDFLPLTILTRTPLDNAAHNSFELFELHLNGGAGPGLRRVVGNGLRVSFNPINEIELQPSGGMMLMSSISIR